MVRVSVVGYKKRLRRWNRRNEERKGNGQKGVRMILDGVAR